MGPPGHDPISSVEVGVVLSDWVQPLGTPLGDGTIYPKTQNMALRHCAQPSRLLTSFIRSRQLYQGQCNFHFRHEDMKLKEVKHATKCHLSYKLRREIYNPTVRTPQATQNCPETSRLIQQPLVYSHVLANFLGLRKPSSGPMCEYDLSWSTVPKHQSSQIL